MKQIGHSEAVEMYLKSLAVLGGAKQPVAVAQLAERLQVTTVSVNEMLHRLTREGLVKPEYVAADGLHPSGAMYSLWVERILVALTPRR